MIYGISALIRQQQLAELVASLPCGPSHPVEQLSVNALSLFDLQRLCRRCPLPTTIQEDKKGETFTAHSPLTTKGFNLQHGSLQQRLCWGEGWAVCTCVPSLLDWT